MSAVAAVAIIVYIWWKHDGARLVNELVIEVSLLVVLGLAVTTFADDTKDFRRRIKAAVALTYACGLFSVVAFGVTSALGAWRGRTHPSVRNISYRVSQTAWFLFIFTSLAALVAYLTVHEETDAANYGAGEAVMSGLLLPAFLSVAIIISHCICSCAACCCRQGNNHLKWYRWRDTSAYHEMTHKILLTVTAVLLLVFPGYLASNGGSFAELDAGDDPNSFTTQDLVTFLIDVLAAGIHRMSLAEFDRDIGQKRAKELEGEEEAIKNGALSDASPPASMASIPSPATSAAVSGSGMAPAPTAPPPRHAPPHHQNPVPPQRHYPAQQMHPQPALPTPPTHGAGAGHDGWKAARAADGRMYYHNAASGETSWSWPPAPRPAPAAAPVAAHTEQLAPGWSAARAPDGRTYYFHAQSGSRSWVVPNR